MKVGVRLMWVALAATACDKGEPPPPAPASPGAAPVTSAPAPAVTPLTPATAAPAANDTVPTEEDFEEEAERGITSDNLEAELDKLEREIGQ